MWTVIQLALKGGFKTSEFWLAVLGMVVTASAPAIEAKIAALHNAAATGSGTAALVAGIGAAVISGAYTVARAITKAKGLSAAAATVTPSADTTPSGNVVSYGPGTAALEDAHRAAVVGATNALETARRALEAASNLPRPAGPGPVPSAGIPDSSAVYPPAAGPATTNG